LINSLQNLIKIIIIFFLGKNCNHLKVTLIIYPRNSYSYTFFVSTTMIDRKCSTMYYMAIRWKRHDVFHITHDHITSIKFNIHVNYSMNLICIMNLCYDLWCAPSVLKYKQKLINKSYDLWCTSSVPKYKQKLINQQKLVYLNWKKWVWIHSNRGDLFKEG